MDKRLKVNFSPWGNFGDTAVPYMLRKLNVPFIFTHHTVEKKLLMIGSILGVGNRKDTIVWGTGIVDDKTVALPNANYIAVRGPRTLEKLKIAGVNTDNVLLGDPAMILPKVYTPKKEKKYKLGLIPHISDYAEVDKYMKENIDKFPNTLIIDPNTKVSQIEPFIEAVNSCEKVVSTCLHGIVCAHAYGIPAVWMKVSNRLVGDDVKFYDHFESLGLTLDGPLDWIPDENVEIPEQNIVFDIEKYWASRPWLTVGEDYYVDIDNEDWTKEVYPLDYTGKIVDDIWWER